MNPATAKDKYLHRPDDILLPRIWEQMRLRQRELSWSQYLMNAQMANCSGLHPAIAAISAYSQCQEVVLLGIYAASFTSLGGLQ